MQTVITRLLIAGFIIVICSILASFVISLLVFSIQNPAAVLAVVLSFLAIDFIMNHR